MEEEKPMMEEDMHMIMTDYAMESPTMEPIRTQMIEPNLLSEEPAMSPIATEDKLPTGWGNYP